MFLYLYLYHPCFRATFPFVNFEQDVSAECWNFKGERPLIYIRCYLSNIILTAVISLLGLRGFRINKAKLLI